MFNWIQKEKTLCMGIDILQIVYITAERICLVHVFNLYSLLIKTICFQRHGICFCSSLASHHRSTPRPPGHWGSQQRVLELPSKLRNTHIGAQTRVLLPAQSAGRSSFWYAAAKNYAPTMIPNMTHVLTLRPECYRLRPQVDPIFDSLLRRGRCLLCCPESWRETLIGVSPWQQTG